MILSHMNPDQVRRVEAEIMAGVPGILNKNNNNENTEKATCY